jgi:simple sugar transport system permease protein
MMLNGAFFSFWAASATGSATVGILAGLGSGIATAAVMALLSINARADQIIVGLGLTILATGLTTYAFQEHFGSSAQVLLNPIPSARIPLLARIPGGVGDALFNQPPLVYLAFLLVPASSILLYKTSWGLAIRSAGDLPEATETAGRSVHRTRWLATLTAGGLAGIGGAYLSVGSIGTFLNQMTAGRGYLALAAVIFGAWRPVGALAGCFLFGGADALELRLQGLPSVPHEVWLALVILLVVSVAVALVRRRGQGPLRVRPDTTVFVALALIVAGVTLYFVKPSFQLPDQLWLSAPYVLTLVALAGLRNRDAMPRFLGVPYVRGAEE